MGSGAWLWLLLALGALWGTWVFLPGFWGGFFLDFGVFLGGSEGV